MQQRQTHESARQLAVGLGWFSVSLGLAELLAPRGVARLAGLPHSERSHTLIRSFGARELANGIAILSKPDEPTWMWGRVGGDAIDLAALAGAMGSPATDRGRTAMATIAVLGVTALDALCAQQLGQLEEEHTVSSRDRRAATARPVEEAITINAPIEQVRSFWLLRERLPETLDAMLQGVAPEDVVMLRPAPGARGTEVRIRIPAAQAQGFFTKLARVAGQDLASRVRDDLRKVKQLIEVGEITISEGPSLRRPAQPASDPGELRAMAGVER